MTTTTTSLAPLLERFLTRRREARAHRRVGLAFMKRLMTILGYYPAWVRFSAAIAIDLEFARRYLFPGGLDRPILLNAMPTPLDRVRETPGPTT